MLLIPCYRDLYVSTFDNKASLFFTDRNIILREFYHVHF